MNARIKSCLLVLFLFFIFLSAGTVEGSCIDVNPVHLIHKGGVQENSRKLLGFDSVLDYDYAGPNPKHDPRGKKGGGSFKNP